MPSAAVHAECGQACPKTRPPPETARDCAGARPGGSHTDPDQCVSVSAVAGLGRPSAIRWNRSRGRLGEID